MNSLFITFEGIEGCGKSTQAKLLTDNLRRAGYKVLFTREPGGPPISEKIRDILLDPEHSKMHRLTEIFLYMASRSQHTMQWIKPALEKGTIVICDRYYDSTYAYQGAARKIPRDIVHFINKVAINSVKPDITFLIDVPVKIGLKRIGKTADKKSHTDRLENESDEFHKAVRKSYLELSKTQKDRIIILDGQDEISTLQRRVKNILSNKFEINL